MIRTAWIAWIAGTLGLVAAATGCGKGDAKDGAQKGKGGELPADHVAAVNAAVPADLKDKLQFEAGKVGDDKHAFKAAIPRGWKKGFMPGSLEPSDTETLGSKTLGRTKLSIRSSCDGDCVKKDWAAASDKELFAQFTSGKTEGKVVKDDKRPTGRTLVFEPKLSPMPEHDVAAYLYTAWWDPEGSRYYACIAELGQPVRGALDAFEKACSKVIQE
jgi:hypothetical protein